MRALLRELQALVPQVGHLVSYRKNLPPAAEPLLRPELGRLENEFHQMLNAFAEAFRQGDCRRDYPTLKGALQAMDETVQQIRQSGILNVHWKHRARINTSPAKKIWPTFSENR